MTKRRLTDEQRREAAIANLGWRTQPQPLETRLWSRVNKQAPNGCWEWTGAVQPNGYAHIDVSGGGGKQQFRGVHRVVYELLVGPIPPGLHIDHLCRNRRCCNPAHLEPVTCRENLMRGDTLQAHAAAKTHCLRGHPLSGENLMLDSRGHRQCRACKRRRSRERQRHPATTG